MAERTLWPGVVCLAGVCFASLMSCGKHDAPAIRELTLATTTSTEDSGLLDVLLPAFEKETGIHAKVVAVGSGQAMELGRRGDADVLLTHSPAAEEQFMKEGRGAQRQAVMHNDFVLVGPASDPAKIKNAAAAAEALRAIAAGSHPFVSRADESGTHVKERALWQSADVMPGGEWYLQAGTGMGQALRLADEKGAYILADRATCLALRDELASEILFEGDPGLLNHYSVITVNPEKHPHVRAAEAEQFAVFLTSPPAQNLIGKFGVERYGQPLFFPDAGKP